MTRRLRAEGLASLNVDGRLPNGETGAIEARDDAGRRRVIKWSDDPAGFEVRTEAHGVAERLRDEAGWPLPDQQLLSLPDLQVIVMDRLPGTNPRRLELPLIDELAALDLRRRQLAPPAGPSRFGQEIVTTLVHGGAGYCRHESLRSHSPQTRRLEGRIVEIGRSHLVGDFPTTDLVHFDLHGGNILVQDGTLTGIVDAEFATFGDAGFDLVTLATCARELPTDHEVSQRLWQLVDERVDASLVPAYAAHVLLRCADWDIRNHGGETLDVWLQEAERQLQT